MGEIALRWSRVPLLGWALQLGKTKTNTLNLGPSTEGLQETLTAGGKVGSMFSGSAPQRNSHEVLHPRDAVLGAWDQEPLFPLLIVRFASAPVTGASIPQETGDSVQEMR